MLRCQVATVIVAGHATPSMNHIREGKRASFELLSLKHKPWRESSSSQQSVVDHLAFSENPFASAVAFNEWCAPRIETWCLAEGSEREVGQSDGTVFSKWCTYQTGSFFCRYMHQSRRCPRLFSRSSGGTSFDRQL